MSGCVNSVAALVLATLVQSGCAAAEIADPDTRADEVATEERHTPLALQGRRPATETGTATWYGPGLEGRSTASGERFSSHGLTAAHKTLPFGTRVRITALDTLTSVVVTINDRLPAASRHIVDVSQAAGKILKMIGTGIARVRIEIVD